MSWGAQNRFKDAKTPSVGRGMSEKPELDRCPVQPYIEKHRKELSESRGAKIQAAHMSRQYIRCFIGPPSIPAPAPPSG